MYVGIGFTHEDGIPNFESLDAEKSKQCRTFLIPKGGSLVSQGATVTSSDPMPVAGELSFITDGDADGVEGNFVELAPGLQWVQLDLGASHHIWKVLLWHYHRHMAVFYDVVVQVSDDPKFATGVQTIFNNDHDNSSGLGAGPDPNYVETYSGRLIDGCGAKGRYLRFYSSGGKGHDVNHYLEISVYGTPSSS
jgi:hypothetical protein